ncbi:MAG: DUF3054 domain-containing protein [Acidimicrobiales bacterium]
MRRLWVVPDVIVVLIFVAIGRSVHDHGVKVVGMLSTSWPFLAGLALAWLAVARWHREGTSLVDGAVLCFITVTVGMVLRVLAGQGTAVAFILVALCFLGAGMLGWRILLSRFRRQRSASRSADSTS